MANDGYKMGFLKYCVERVLPLVYDESLSYYELLAKVVQKINDVITNQNNLYDLYDDVKKLYAEFETLAGEVQKEIDDAIAGIDNEVYNQVNEIITQMINEGALDNISNPLLASITVNYLTDQGDCFLVYTNQDKLIMIDSGYQTADAQSIISGITAYKDKVDYLIITHFDPDHVNGIINRLFDAYLGSWTTVFIGIHDTTEVTWYNENITTVISILTQLGCNIVYVTEGQTVEIGLLSTLQFFNTIASEAYTKDEKGTNDRSLFTLMTFANRRILFTGDSNKTAQRVNYTSLQKVDVMALPHHGNYYSVYKPFLAKVAPEYAFASDNDESTPGYPTHGMKRQFCDTGCQVFTINETGKTFHIKMYVGSIECDGQAYEINDILNGGMINDTVGVTTDYDLTDDMILDAMDTFTRMFASFPAGHLNADNKYFLNNRTNNVFGYRGATTNRTVYVQTQYDWFNILRYSTGTEMASRSFAFGQITMKVEAGVVTSVTQRELSDMLVVGSSNNFTVRSSRPLFVFMSSVSDNTVNNAASIQNSSNTTLVRIIRPANSQETNPTMMFLPGYGTILHLGALTETTFVVNFIAL